MGTPSNPFDKTWDGKDVPITKAPLPANRLASATITVGTPSGTSAITIQLNDGLGNALATRASLLAYLSDDANGDSITATGPSTETTIGTDGVLMALIAKKLYLLTSEADGDIDLTITEAGSATWYLVLIMPDGSLVVSGAIAF